MSQSTCKTAFARVVGAAAISACALGTGFGATGCEVTADADYPTVDGDYPPAAFVATAEPVYYEGHAAYWYHNRWVFREGGGWHSYRTEPHELAQRRAQGGVVRRNYGRASTARTRR